MGTFIVNTINPTSHSLNGRFGLGSVKKGRVKFLLRIKGNVSDF